MRKSFLAVCGLALSASAGYGQFTYPVQGAAQTCPAGGYRPVQAVVTGVHNAVVNSAEVVRGVWADPTVSPWHVQSPAAIPQRMPSAVTFTPGQPVRNLLRAVKSVVAK